MMGTHIPAPTVIKEWNFGFDKGYEQCFPMADSAADCSMIKMDDEPVLFRTMRLKKEANMPCESKSTMMTRSRKREIEGSPNNKLHPEASPRNTRLVRSKD
jgi:hypothetical protein